MHRFPFRYAIALTGGIATGKSTVAQRFAQAGYAIIDADKVAHAILASEASWIAETFGEHYLRDGAPDRAALGTLVFSDESARKRLEAHLHPLIRAEIVRRSEVHETERVPYLIEIPLFFESGAYPIERSVLVYAPEALQLQRLMRRDGLSVEQARRRIEAQMPIEKKRTMARYTIDNSGDQAQMQREFERVEAQIRKDMQA